MLQIIPEIKDNLESLEHLSVLAETLSPQELFSLPLEESLSRLFAHEQTKIFGQNEVVFKCICSKQRCENALLQLSHDEINNLIEDNGTSMTCQHCGKTYKFDKDELTTLLRKISQ